MRLNRCAWASTCGLRTAQLKRALGGVNESDMIQTGNQLETLRLVSAFMSAGVALISVPVFILYSLGDLVPTVDATGIAMAVVAGNAIVVNVLVRVLLPALVAETDETLAATYTARFFVRLPFANTSSLIGFVAFVLTVQPLCFFIGLVGTALCLISIVPSNANLDRDQDRLDDSLQGRSLRQALTSSFVVAQ